jgi:hypothetical protein
VSVLDPIGGCHRTGCRGVIYYPAPKTRNTATRVVDNGRHKSAASNAKPWRENSRERGDWGREAGMTFAAR